MKRESNWYCSMLISIHAFETLIIPTIITIILTPSLIQIMQIIECIVRLSFKKVYFNV